MASTHDGDLLALSVVCPVCHSPDGMALGRTRRGRAGAAAPGDRPGSMRAPRSRLPEIGRRTCCTAARSALIFTLCASATAAHTSAITESRSGATLSRHSNAPQLSPSKSTSSWLTYRCKACASVTDKIGVARSSRATLRNWDSIDTTSYLPPRERTGNTPRARIPTSVGLSATQPDPASRWLVDQHPRS